MMNGHDEPIFVLEELVLQRKPIRLGSDRVLWGYIWGERMPRANGIKAEEAANRMRLVRDPESQKVRDWTEYHSALTALILALVDGLNFTEADSIQVPEAVRLLQYLEFIPKDAPDGNSTTTTGEHA